MRTRDFLLIVGIVLFAFAMKYIISHVGEELDSHGLRARGGRALPAHVLGNPDAHRTAARS